MHKFFKRNLVIGIILALAAFLRFYNIDTLTTFGGDQGYDYGQVRNIIVEKNPTLLGPKVGPYTSSGNLYLGPAYYYLLLPSLLLANFDPIGPAILTAIFAVFTIFLIYKISEEFLNKYIGTLAALLYAINPFLVAQARSPSNPHFTPFFTALAIYSLLKIVKNKSNRLIWPILAGVSCGISFQMHYLGITLFIFSFIFLLKKARKSSVVFFLAFLLAISPQIIFEIRHQFFVTNLALKAFSQGNNLTQLPAIVNHSFSALENLGTMILGQNWLFLMIFLSIIIVNYCTRNRRFRSIILALLTLALLGILTPGFYAGEIHLHYLVVSYVPVFVLLGVALFQLFVIFKNLLYRIATFIVLSLALISNMQTIDLNSNQGYTMPQGWNQSGIRQVSKTIAAESKNSNSFNIANTLDGDTRAMPYRYLVEVYGSKPQPVEAYQNLDHLYVITRDDNEHVLEYTVWEVSAFKPFKIVKEWQFQNGIRLLKLEKSENE